MTSSEIGTVEWNAALGQTIKVRRTDVGMSRQQLADASSISYSYLSAIENGTKTPSTKILRVLAERLGLEAHELLTLVDARLERGSSPEGSVPDEVIDIIERQEARFRDRQEARLTRRARGASEAQRTLLSLIDVLDDRNVMTLTKVAQGLVAFQQRLDDE